MTTFIADWTQQADWQRVFGINWHRVLELLDLREENTLATWFSSVLFLCTGIGFLLLGWGQSAHFVISQWTRLVFQLATIGAIFLSADEVASIHETAGKWFKRVINHFVDNIQDERGYSWILLFAPFLVMGLVFALYGLQKLINNMPITRNWQRQQAYFALGIALFCLPGVFVFEAFEWRLSLFDQNITQWTAFEELFEIMGMYSLFFCTVLVAKQYQL